MSDNNSVPKLNRSSRTSETREATARRKPWQPPSRLDTPPAPEGYSHRWIRAESNGVDDRINVQGKLREGYELVRADEYPDQMLNANDGKYSGVIGVGDLLLARIPEETANERAAHYRSRTRDQMTAVDNDLLKTNAHSSMKISRPNRQSQVQLGGPKAPE
tara:strand:+ start:5385 stop:5867 length:483 start_codon:yes stop_codon:yes gene_type:complete